MVNPNGKILVSVVIPTLDREKLLLETLKKLICQKFLGFEIIVVDQSDLELPLVEEFVLEHQDIVGFFRIEERGLPNARNFGVSRARGEIIIFCDDDVIPLNGFLQSHFSNYADMNISGVAGRVLSPGEETKGHNTEGNSHKIAKTRWLNLRQYDNFDSQIKTEAHHTQGCNMSFRKSVINELGGFDTRFGGSAHLEETDFCMRVRSAGYKMVFEPRAALVHLKDSAGGCRAKDWETWFYWYGHNHALLYSKNTRNPLLLMAIKGIHILISSLKRGHLSLFYTGIKGMREGFIQARG